MHASLVRGDECVLNDLLGVVVQADVVERELERLARRLEERCDLARDVDRRLAPVGEGVDLDQVLCRAGLFHC